MLNMRIFFHSFHSCKNIPNLLFSSKFVERNFLSTDIYVFTVQYLEIFLHRVCRQKVFNHIHTFMCCVHTFQSTKSNAIKHLGLLCLAPEIIDRPTGPQPETTTMSLILMSALSTPWSPQDKG